MSEAERREHPRVKMVTRVIHVASGITHYYHSQDVSLGGMFLETRKPYRMGTKVRLDFSLPDRDARVLVEGEVKRVVEPDFDAPDQIAGMGIEFHHVNDSSLAELKDFLRKHID